MCRLPYIVLIMALSGYFYNSSLPKHNRKGTAPSKSLSAFFDLSYLINPDDMFSNIEEVVTKA